jgi:hypothetical protein
MNEVFVQHYKGTKNHMEDYKTKLNQQRWPHDL